MVVYVKDKPIQIGFFVGPFPPESMINQTTRTVIFLPLKTFKVFETLKVFKRIPYHFEGVANIP